MTYQKAYITFGGVLARNNATSGTLYVRIKRNDETIATFSISGSSSYPSGFVTSQTIITDTTPRQNVIYKITYENGMDRSGGVGYRVSIVTIKT